jgi:predicted GNAT family N-acyltransferase
MKSKTINVQKPALATQLVTIKTVTWKEAEDALRSVRTPVFIDEQLVTPTFEWDDIDANAVHLLAMVEQQTIGCLRIIEYQKIGRMAVLKNWRGLGIGAALLAEAVNICRNHGEQYIQLSAQTHAIAFYEKAGFVQVSDEYCDVNIPHVDMQLSLA